MNIGSTAHRTGMYSQRGVYVIRCRNHPRCKAKVKSEVVLDSYPGDETGECISYTRDERRDEFARRLFRLGWTNLGGWQCPACSEGRTVCESPIRT